MTNKIPPQYEIGMRLYWVNKEHDVVTMEIERLCEKDTAGLMHVRTRLVEDENPDYVKQDHYNYHQSFYIQKYRLPRGVFSSRQEACGAASERCAKNEDGLKSALSILEKKRMVLEQGM